MASDISSASGVGRSSALYSLYRELESGSASSSSRSDLANELQRFQSMTMSNSGFSSTSANDFSSASDGFGSDLGSVLLSAQEDSGATSMSMPPPPPPMDGAGGSSSSSSDALSSLLSSLDTDGDGSISKSEFTSAARSARAAPPPPPGGFGGASEDDYASTSSSSASSTSSASASSTSHDPLDTNKDGIVSDEERAASLANDNSQTRSVNALSSRIGSAALGWMLRTFNSVAA